MTSNFPEAGDVEVLIWMNGNVNRLIADCVQEYLTQMYPFPTRHLPLRGR